MPWAARGFALLDLHRAAVEARLEHLRPSTNMAMARIDLDTPEKTLDSRSYEKNTVFHALAVLAAACPHRRLPQGREPPAADAAEETGHVEAPAGTVVLTPEAVAGGGIVVEPVRTTRDRPDDHGPGRAGA